MKKILIIITMLLGVYKLTAQVLYTDNFDNYSVGNLGTDPNGVVPGQGGWQTRSSITQSNSFFTIVNETGKGKVLDITSGLTDYESFIVFKQNLAPLFTNRAPGNEVLMFEIDYYTGSKQVSNSGNHSTIGLSLDDPLKPINQDVLFSFLYNKTDGSILGRFNGGQPDVFGDTQNDNYYLPFNTWIKIIVYLDYTNRKGYFYIPYLNKAFADNFLINEQSTNLLQDFVPHCVALMANASGEINGPLIYTRNRYDNIKITAIKAVPPNIIALSTSEQLATKFNLYPNPATNVVNITNAENMLVNQVTIYDIAGKQLSTQNFNNEAEIQLNIESLASGTYMLYLQTAEGIAVKKLIKK